MAKKHQKRAHVSIRKKKEQQQKQQRNKEFIMQNLQKIIFLATIVVMLITSLILVFDYFGAPDGSMRIFLGKVQDVEENTVVTNLGSNKDPRYYTVAWYAPPEGYSEDPTFFGTSGNERRMMFRADDENAMINTITITGIRQKTAAAYAEILMNMASMAQYTSFTDVKEADLAGKHIYYLYTTTTLEGDAEHAYASLSTYADTIKDSCVHVGFSTINYPIDQLPTEEMLLEAAEAYFTDIQILQPDNTRK